MEVELKSVVVLVNNCRGDMKDEYCGYEIEIVTSKGTIRIEGCHDMTPTVHANQDLQSLIQEDPE